MKVSRSDLKLLKSWTFVKQLKVEPFIFLVMMAVFLKSRVSRQLTQDKICMNDLDYPSSICYNVTSRGSKSHQDDKAAILKTSTDYQLYSTLITTLPCLIYAMFLGSWSDKFVSGRKLMMLAGGVGLVLDLSVDMVNVVYFDLPAPFLLLAIVPSAMLGGVFTVFTAVYSYTSRTSTPDMRAIRFAILEMMLALAAPFASFFAGHMLNTEPWFFHDRLRNYVGLFTVNIALVLPAVVWVYFVINETEDPVQDGVINSRDEDLDLEEVDLSDVKDGPWYSPLKRIFDLENVKTMLRILKIRRPHGDHRKVWLMIFGYCIGSLGLDGDRDVQYQYCENVFSWTFVEHANVSSLFSLLHLSVPLIIVPVFMKKLQMSLPVLGAFATLSWTVSCLVRGLVITEVGFYASLVLHIPASMSIIASRAYISTLVKPKEIGSIFAVMACAHALMPLLASLIFTRLFNATIITSPGLVWLIMASFIFVFFCIFVYAEVKRFKTY